MEPYEALQCFTHSFELRYGAMHPLFLLGSLSEAVSEATIGSASSGSVSCLFVRGCNINKIFIERSWLLASERSK